MLAQNPADARVLNSRAKLGLAKQSTDPEAFEAMRLKAIDSVIEGAPDAVALVVRRPTLP